VPTAAIRLQLDRTTTATDPPFQTAIEVLLHMCWESHDDRDEGGRSMILNVPKSSDYMLSGID
jgi:hypothetical protein